MFVPKGNVRTVCIQYARIYIYNTCSLGHPRHPRPGTVRDVLPQRWCGLYYTLIHTPQSYIIIIILLYLYACIYNIYIYNDERIVAEPNASDSFIAPVDGKRIYTVPDHPMALAVVMIAWEQSNSFYAQLLVPKLQLSNCTRIPANTDNNVPVDVLFTNLFLYNQSNDNIMDF